MSYWQMRKVIEAQRKALGLQYVEIPDRVITLEKDISRIQGEIRRLKLEKAPEEKIGEAAVALANAEYALKQLLISKGIK